MTVNLEYIEQILDDTLDRYEMMCKCHYSYIIIINKLTNFDGFRDCFLKNHDEIEIRLLSRNPFNRHQIKFDINCNLNVTTGHVSITSINLDEQTINRY